MHRVIPNNSGRIHSLTAAGRGWCLPKRIGALLTVVLGMLLGQNLYGQLYFDVNGDGNGSGKRESGVTSNSSYVWSGTFWTTDPNGGTATAPVGAWTSGSNAVFSAGADATGTYQVRIGANTTVGTVSREEGTPSFKVIGSATSTNWTITGSSSLSVSNLTLLGGSTTNATLTLGGSGTATSYTFANLYVSGATVLDFANTAGSTITFGNVYLASGATLSITNWAAATDALKASAVFTGGTYSENATTFAQSYAGGSSLGTGSWATGVSINGVQAQWNGSTLQTFTPIPEPSTYGTMLIAGCAGLFGLRRWRAKRRAVRV